jgi:uncharacterized protein YndB with AHSA1/START domain
MTVNPTPIDELVVTRTIHAPPHVVYRVWTERELARRWSWGARFDTIDVEIDCRVGGQWKQNVRDRKTQEVWSFDGVFLSIEPTRRLKFTFHWRNDRGADHSRSVVDVEFRDLGDSTEIIIRQTGIANIEERRGTQSGWVDVLGCIASVAEAPLQ